MTEWSQSIDDPADLSVAQACAAIRAGTLTPSVLLAACLARVDAREGSLKAWNHLAREQAVADAAALDREAAAGRWRGPLHGIPAGIKDIFDVAAMPNTANSRALADNIATADAPSVHLLRQAGAVIMGKTATAEFALLDPPPTRNPWKLDHTPGGSSSGSAAAVAAGMCIAALGTQTGGSTIRPAAYCGIVGFKPTYETIDRAGVFPLSGNIDHVGIFGREVEDAELMAEAMARVPLGARQVCERPPRIGWLTGYFLEKASAAVAAEITRVAHLIERSGAEVRELAPPSGLDGLVATFMTIVAAQAANHHRPLESRRHLYGPKIRELVERGLEIKAVDYLLAEEARARFSAEMDARLSDVDALLLPAAPAPAPAGMATGDFTFNSPWTMCGVPVITIPSALIDGLPVGIQLIGPRHRDRRLLAVSRWCEQALEVHLRPPLNPG